MKDRALDLLQQAVRQFTEGCDSLFYASDHDNRVKLLLPKAWKLRREIVKLTEEMVEEQWEVKDESEENKLPF